MIDMGVSGTLPQFNQQAFSGAMRECGDVMLRSVMGNFNLGGRPNTWQAKKTGWPSYLKGSPPVLMGSLFMRSGDDFAEVGVPTSIPYAAIHNFGGVIENGFGKGIRINMPKRQYLMFQDQDKIDIVNLLGGRVPKFFEPVPIQQ